ncbi:uncharacterized protein LOC144624033 [Crassostrea virginica]
MATNQDKTVNLKVNDITVCSICFEKFKTPRYLPCKHSFCHDCLCSYIVSQCKSTESRLGFHCPLCRQYTVSDGDIKKPEKWAKYFPLNKVLEKMVSQSDNEYCELCLRDNEEQTASNYCLSCKEYMCALCSKFHMKCLPTKDHKIVSLFEMESGQFLPTLEVANRCPMHCNEEIQLYCADHEQLCCGLCGATTHKKCENINMVNKAAQDLTERGDIDSLIDATNAFKEKLFCVKTEKEINKEEIQNTEDEKRLKFEEEFRSMMQHLEKLKGRYLDEISSTSKKGKEKLQKEIDRIEDSIMCLNSCIQSLQMAKDTCNEKEMLMKFLTAKKTFTKLKKTQFKYTLKVKVERDITPLWNEIGNLQNIATVHLNEVPRLVDTDVKNFKLTVYKRFTVEKGNITSGLFLSSGDFLLVNESEGSCMVYDEQWHCCHTIKCVSNPHDVTQSEEGIIVTNPVVKQIEVFSSINSERMQQFQKLRSIPVPCSVKRITSFEENLFVSSKSNILIIDNKGNITRLREGSFVYPNDIAVTKSGLILWTECYEFVTYGKVVAVTNKGDNAWEYKNSSLKSPHGLDVDSFDHIYVAGRDDNSVHVLSNVGALIRIIENIPKPLFIKVNEARGTVWICSGGKEIIVYKINCVHTS